MRRFLNKLVNGFRSTNATRPARRANPARARLSVETLEDRVTPTVNIDVINITGTSGNDTITIDAINRTDSYPGDIKVTLNDQPSMIVSYAPGITIEIDPGTGTNMVNILQLPLFGSGPLNPIDNVFVNCQGTDNIIVGNDTSGGVYLVKGAVHVNGNGATSVTMDDSGYTNPGFLYEVDAQSASWFGVEGSGVFWSNVANFTLNGGPAENVNVVSTAAGTVYNINTGAGQNSIKLGSDTAGLNQSFGTVAVFGNGTDTIDLSDRLGNIKANYDITYNVVRRNGGIALLTYSGIGNLTVDGTQAGDTYMVRSTASSTSYVIDAGNAGGLVKDIIYLAEGRVDALAGAVTVNNEGGNVNVVLDDHGDSLPQTFTLGASSVVSPTNFFGGLTYSGITTLSVDGGTGANTFAMTATPTTSVSLIGGSGSNKLIGPDAATAWTINGQDRGTLGTNVFFSSIGNLVGGSGNDTFALARKYFPVPTVGSITGSISGGGGSNTLDYSLFPFAVGVNLGTHGASQIRAGAAGGFANINKVVGSASAADTLTGANAYTDWLISAANGGKSGSVDFAGFENLIGGSGVDSFRFSALGSLSGTLDGGLAPAHQGNWLDYSGLTTPVTVNLQTGKATDVAGGATGKVVNIQNVHGGNGLNSLTGNSHGNILIGGTSNDTLIGGSGRSILIGDAGSDTVRGGSGSDILIGDRTALDAMTTSNQKALMAILAEWQSADSYATRFADINTGTGGGLNGTAKLNFGTTVLDDGSADTVRALASNLALNWFFEGVGDVLQYLHNGEHVNNS